MLSPEKSPTDVAHRLKIENEKLPIDRQFNSVDLGTFLLAAMTRSPFKKAQKYGENLKNSNDLEYGKMMSMISRSSNQS